MPLIDLSHTVVSGMAQWPGDDQPLRLIPRGSHEADGHQSTALALGCHVGTHIDAPLHFRAGEPGLDRLAPDRFTGPALVVDVRPSGPIELGPEILDGCDLQGIDFVLVLTGWDRHWGTPRYYAEWPWLSADLARRLAAARLKGVGLDTPSLDPFGGDAAHLICAAAGLINIENLRGLEQLPARGAELSVLPLKLLDTEASPVRAVARLEPR